MGDVQLEYWSASVCMCCTKIGHVLLQLIFNYIFIDITVIITGITQNTTASRCF